MKTRISKFLLFFILFSSCTQLLVENPNEPDLTKVFSTTEELHNYAGNAFRTLHNAMQEYWGPANAMAAMADQNTCSWGFGSVNILSNEPRRGYINSTQYAYIYTTNGIWENIYGAISSANDILRLIDDKSEFLNSSDKKRYEAWGNFISGVGHGYLGLTFDKAHIVSGNAETDSLGYTPWQDVVSYSLAILDKSIEISKNNSFSIPAEWMGGEVYSNLDLAELANSYAARILAYSSRNKAHNENIDWSQILNYTNKGIQNALAPEIGDKYHFNNYYLVYAIYPGWVRIDHRIINLMDSDYPSRWPEDGVSWTTPDGQDPGPAESVDARLESDFQYLQENNFARDRGMYHFSHYRHKRYDDFMARVWWGDIPHPSFLVWENELLKAEAFVRTGDIAKAVSILNNSNGARKVRGKLPDLTTSNPKEVLWHIFYERDVELINTGMGISYFDMRRRDNLQRGTILHFPVPVYELQITLDEVYTIGGAPDGENVSEGNWTGLDGITSPLY